MGNRNWIRHWHAQIPHFKANQSSLWLCDHFIYWCVWSFMVNLSFDLMLQYQYRMFTCHCLFVQGCMSSKLRCENEKTTRDYRSDEYPWREKTNNQIFSIGSCSWTWRKLNLLRVYECCVQDIHQSEYRHRVETIFSFRFFFNRIHFHLKFLFAISDLGHHWSIVQYLYLQ